jgi:hypothetical protein
MLNSKSRSISLIAYILVLQALIAPIAAAPDYFFSASDDTSMRKWVFNSTTSQNTAVIISPLNVYSLALGKGGQTVYSGRNSGTAWMVTSNDATTLAAGTTYTGPTSAMDNVIVVNDTLLCASWGSSIKCFNV